MTSTTNTAPTTPINTWTAEELRTHGCRALDAVAGAIILLVLDVEARRPRKGWSMACEARHEALVELWGRCMFGTKNLRLSVDAGVPAALELLELNPIGSNGPVLSFIEELLDEHKREYAQMALEAIYDVVAVTGVGRSAA